MSDTSKQTGSGMVTFLSDEQKRRIYDAALGILADIGMKVLHDEGEAVMLQGGCARDADGLVHVPAELVERARATAPASFTVYDRDGEPAMQVGGRNAYYGNGSDLMHLYDLETGERRLGRLDDVSAAARLCDALPEHRLRHVRRLAGRHGRAPHLPAPVQPHDQAHHQAPGHDRGRRGDGGAHVAHGLRAAGRRPGAAREALLHHVQPAREPAQAPLRDRGQAAVLRRQRHPVHLLPVARGRRHGAHHRGRPDHAGRGRGALRPRDAPASRARARPS